MRGGFRFYKFMFNSKEVVEFIFIELCVKEIKEFDLNCDLFLFECVFGVEWNIVNDVFKFCIFFKDKLLIRCGILLIVSLIYDLFGFVVLFLF